MRAVASWLAWLVAVVVALLTVPLLWISTHVASEDGWVDFTAGFVEDPELREGAVTAVSQAALARVTLPADLSAVVERVFREVVRTTAESKGFAEGWRESLRRTHRLTFGPDANQDRLVVDIGPLATFVVTDIAGDLPVKLSVPNQILVPVYAAPDPELLDNVRASHDRSRVLLAVAGVAMMASMVAAGGLMAAVRRLGLGVLAVALLMLTATGVVLPELLDRSPAGSQFAHQMRALLVAHTADSLDAWAIVLLVVGGVVTVVGLAGGLLGRVVRT